MKLKTAEVKAALTGWKSLITVCYGVVSILLISPCLTFWTITWSFIEKEFAIGISIFFAQATTLSSGPIIAAQANGNVALALLLTVFTNILAVGTMPLFISFTISQFGDANVTVDPVPIIIKLCFLLILPLFVGKLMRIFKFVQTGTKNFKVLMKLLASALLAIIVWINISDSQESLEDVEGKSIGILFATGLGIHLVLLAFNYTVTTFILRLAQPEKRSVVILTSQKTLPVALTVLEVLGDGVVGESGLVAIPLIISHFVQIVFDAFLAAFWGDIPIEDELVSIPDDNTEISEDNEEASDNIDQKEAITLA